MLECMIRDKILLKSMNLIEKKFNHSDATGHADPEYSGSKHRPVDPSRASG